MSDLHERIANLPIEKRRALEALLQRAAPAPAPARAAIPRRDPSAPAPLSFAQQRLWFLDQLAGEQMQSLYTVGAAWRLVGPLDHAALRWALETIQARHEALRTCFPLVDGQPVQLVRPPAPLDIPEIDLRGRSAEERIAEAQRFMEETVQGLFDLANGPLFRASLARLADDEHWLAVSMHHTVSDGWSVGIFTSELTALYAARAAGQPDPLPDLPIQYADFAAWQRDALQGALLDEQLAYWRRQLAGAPPALDLPTDFPRPAVQGIAGATHTLILPAALSDALRPLAQREGATLFMTLLAAFDVLLARYSGQHDISVGTPIAGRPRVETEALIGCFVNTLVLRADLSGDPTFAELLRRVRAVCMDAYARQDLPFEKLVEALQPQRDLSHNPLFQVLFALHNAPRPSVALPGLQMQRLGGENTTSRFDLSLDMREMLEGLVCAFEYNTAIFETATIARMGGHFQALLEAAAADADQRIDALPLLTEPERRQILVEWNAPHAPADAQMPRVDGIHRLFEAHAARTPDAVALVFDTLTNDEGRRTKDEGDLSSLVPGSSSVVHLTYAALNARANQLAHTLRARGSGPEARVGVYAPRSPELIVALLGVLKAGSAYVPLDPAYPPERIAFMLEDSQATAIVTKDGGRRTEDERSATNNEEHNATFVFRPSSLVDLAADWDAIGRQSDSPIDAGGDAANLAYTIYTSGSTGRPKGVQVEHRSVLNLLASTRPVFAPGGDDVWTVVHSYAFDFSVWEIWGSLLNGGRLVVAPLAVTRAPSAFYELICRQRVTILNQTPSAIRGLIAARQAAPALRPALRLLMCGGEAFPRDLAAPLLGWGAPLWNFYGPTEATVWAAINPLAGADMRHEVAPIGRPLAGAQLYVLDSRMRLTPVGVPGELHIGGSQLARGYHARPDLTAERFIPNPFAPSSAVVETQNIASLPHIASLTPHARLYKTGDLARRLPSGEIEFLGRMDGQVKLRGFRIELGEIEAVLGQHPAVRDAVVLAREDAPGDRRLVAYIVQGSAVSGQGSADPALALLTPDPPTLIPALRTFLAERLPEYMIPSAFVAMDALPISSNGKIDRRALPAPDGSRPDLASEYLPPRSALERQIAAIWQETLRVERVGVYDNFFDLGGHSLLMVQVQSRLRETLGREIGLLDMFRHPTVGALAAFFSQGSDEPPALPQSEARTAARLESRDRQQQTLQSRRQARRAATAQKGEQDD